MEYILKDYVGRETPLYYAERLSQHYKRCAASLGRAGGQMLRRRRHRFRVRRRGAGD